MFDTARRKGGATEREQRREGICARMSVCMCVRWCAQRHFRLSTKYYFFMRYIHQLDIRVCVIDAIETYE